MILIGALSSFRELGKMSPHKRARVQERHWAHFVSAIRLSKSSPSRTMTPKPAQTCCGLANRSSE
jgi:hypothetical protein